MPETIRHLSIEESVQVLHLLENYAFYPTPPLPDREVFSKKIRQQKGVKFFAVYEKDDPQTVAGLRDLTQSVRGKLCQMAGIADVATHPAGRRKGYVRSLLRYIFKISKEAGMVVSCLYPFRESFYERFGYVTFPQTMKILFNPKVLAPLLKMDQQGSVELVKFEEGYDEYLEYLRRLQKATHGLALFTIPNPEMAKERETWLAIARDEGKVIGLMQYTLKGKMMEQQLYAHDFLFDSAQAKFLLLDWIARHIDQVGEAELTLHPCIKGETLFTDLRPEFKGVFLPPMGRVIDLENLAGLPVGAGEITVQVSDPDCEWNNGNWKLASEDGTLTVEKGGEPDCHLTIQGVSALVYGVIDPDEFHLRGWGDPDSESQTILRQMFPAATPFLHAMY